MQPITEGAAGTTPTLQFDQLSIEMDTGADLLKWGWCGTCSGVYLLLLAGAYEQGAGGHEDRCCLVKEWIGSVVHRSGSLVPGILTVHHPKLLPFLPMYQPQRGSGGGGQECGGHGSDALEHLHQLSLHAAAYWQVGVIAQHHFPTLAADVALDVLVVHQVALVDTHKAFVGEVVVEEA